MNFSHNAPMAHDASNDTQQSELVTLNLANGQQVTLSPTALRQHGADMIERMAMASNMPNLLYVDQTMLNIAKRDFPDSPTPFAEMFREYFPAVFSNNDIESSYHQSVMFNAPMALGNGDYGSISGIDTSRASGSDFGRKMANISSGIPLNALENFAGTTEQWAEAILLHEAAHLNGDHSAERATVMLAPTDNPHHPELLGAMARVTLKHENAADLSAVSSFNRAAQNDNDFLNSFRNVRALSVRSMMNADIQNLAANPLHLDNHNTSRSLSNYMDGIDTPVHIDRAVTDSAFLTTLSNSLIAINEFLHLEADSDMRVITRYQGDDLTMITTPITENDFQSAMNGDDPLRLSTLGSNFMNEPNAHTRIYAATNALLDSGKLDSMPEIKREAQIYLNAINLHAPSIVDPDMVKDYRQSLNDPAISKAMDNINTFYNPEARIGIVHDLKTTPELSMNSL